LVLSRIIAPKFDRTINLYDCSKKRPTSLIEAHDMKESAV